MRPGRQKKKHRFQPEVVRGFQKCIKMMIHSTDIATLARINSLNYEELKGDKEGICSVRVNRQYRVEFSVSQTDTEPIVTICSIIDLSNHYK